MTIKVKTLGLLATVQDLGRSEWRSNGVPLGGAADTLSHRIANILVKNDARAATLEIAGGGFRAKVEHAGWLAACGAGGCLFIENKEIGNNRLAFAPEGAELEIQVTSDGNYAYLATPGGWDVPEILGSRSTCLAAGFGGLVGRGLQKGDVLRAVHLSDDSKSPDEFQQNRVWASRYFLNLTTFQNLPNSGEAIVIRALPGPEARWWGDEQQTHFFNTTFTISKQHDRMGARLEVLPTVGKLSNFQQLGTMLSTAVAPGAVQMPPDGQPIILLADAQTTGGYPRIAQVIAVDIPRLAQIPSEKMIHFQRVTLEEAEQLLFEQENFFKKLQMALAFIDR